MHIGILQDPSEARVPLVPDVVQKLVSEGNQVWIEAGAGKGAFFPDEAYQAAGATVGSEKEVLANASLFLSVNAPAREVLAKISGKTLISSFQPFATAELLNDLVSQQLTGFSMDMIPRSTIAQSMDILSSMASISGYRAVLVAATQLPRYFPMLTTAAGSIPPSRVLVIGAGVAGLQAIATAKRLGAVVEAFDTRLAAKEEVESLGAKFVEVEGARDDKAAGGYAVEQTEEYKQKQKELIFEKASKADVIITTAQLRGKPAPLLITQETLDAMKPGSVVVDLAASTGGNCAFTENKKTVLYNQVSIIGDSDLAAGMPMHASQLYSKNIYNFLKVLIKKGEMDINLQNDIIKSTCVVLEGKILYGNNA
jgi:NAD(P) transhydrogenase subunit alpha